VENSRIEWTDHTFNPWWGCVEVSPACDSCYARTFAKRLGFNVWGPTAERRLFGNPHWNEPLKWNAAAVKAERRYRVFCSSMADVFERHADPVMNAVLDDQRSRLWIVIEKTPRLDWLLLTKRPQNIAHMVPRDWSTGFPTNVWIGFTAEAQRYFDTRWRDAQWSAERAAVVFVSNEPALGPLTLSADFLARRQGAWVISGGESGPQARPSHPDWFRAIRDQCVAAGVPFHFKQWGEWFPSTHCEPGLGETKRKRQAFISLDGESHCVPTVNPAGLLFRAGKKIAGRLLDGRTWDELPSPLTSAQATTMA
jgi:protein gp37